MSMTSEEVTDISAAFYKQLRAATTSTQERLAVVAIVQVLASLEAANGND